MKKCRTSGFATIYEKVTIQYSAVHCAIHCTEYRRVDDLTDKSICYSCVQLLLGRAPAITSAMTRMTSAMTHDERMHARRRVSLSEAGTVGQLVKGCPPPAERAWRRPSAEC